MTELGKIERPEAGGFAGKRKLYCIPDVYPAKEAPEEYNGLVKKFWEEAGEHLNRLEAAGAVRAVFCENIVREGDEGLKALERLNPHDLALVKKKTDSGASFVPVEKDEVFGPYIDWLNCMAVVRTREVFMKVHEAFSGLAEKRLKHAAETIADTLKEGEAGVLIMKDEDRMRLDLPKDIELFLVTPPTYSDIHKWLRDRAKDMQGGEEKQS